jgi:hypothetical protein
MPTPIILLSALSTALIKVLLYLLETAAKPVSKLKLEADAIDNVTKKLINVNIRYLINIETKLIRSAVYFTLFILKIKKKA